jgi:hypothetical protein
VTLPAISICDSCAESRHGAKLSAAIWATSIVNLQSTLREFFLHCGLAEHAAKNFSSIADLQSTAKNFSSILDLQIRCEKFSSIADLQVRRKDFRVQLDP